MLRAVILAEILAEARIVPPASVGDTFAGVATSGSLLLAVPVALAAGMLSFLSPCMLPLVPGYLSYVTGLSGADVQAWHGSPAQSGPGTATATALRPAARVRGRMLAGATLFVLGFSAVFVSAGALSGGLGALLLSHAPAIQRVLGVLVVLLGLGFLGMIPFLQREARSHRLPRGGLAGAPVLGGLFGLGWTPCIGPTLAAVLTLAATGASAGRGALLAGVYSIGLGLPFLATALGLRRVLSSLAFARRHVRTVTRIGGALLVVTGLLLVTGLWNALTVELRTWISGVTLPI